jgi:hypothetical protein
VDLVQDHESPLPAPDLVQDGLHLLYFYCVFLKKRMYVCVKVWCVCVCVCWSSSSSLSVLVFRWMGWDGIGLGCGRRRGREDCVCMCVNHSRFHRFGPRKKALHAHLVVAYARARPACMEYIHIYATHIYTIDNIIYIYIYIFSIYAHTYV